MIDCQLYISAHAFDVTVPGDDASVAEAFCMQRLGPGDLWNSAADWFTFIAAHFLPTS